MKITFARHTNRPPTLSCVRDDGSQTWFSASAENGDFFVAHDLLHYAVETTLDYTTAFFGLIGAGRDLNDFGSRGGAKDERPYSRDAIDAERLVGLIQAVGSNVTIDFMSEASHAQLRRAGSPPSQVTIELMSEAWHSAFEDQGSSQLPINGDQLAAICRSWHELLKRWRSLGPSESLELEFG